MGDKEKMSKQNGNKKRKNTENVGTKSVFEKVMISVIVIGIVIFLFINYALPVLKQGTKHVAAEKTVDVIIKNADKVSGGNEKVEEMLNSLSEEDKETVSGIIENHMDSETVSEVMKYVQDGDKESLMKYAADNLTLDEMSELLNMYEKYSWPSSESSNE